MQITILKLMFYKYQRSIPELDLSSIVQLIRSQIGCYAMYRFSRIPQGLPSCKQRNGTTLGYAETS